MGLGGVVLFAHKIATDLFEKNFDHMGAVLVVINNQDAALLFDGAIPPYLRLRVSTSLPRCPIVKSSFGERGHPYRALSYRMTFSTLRLALATAEMVA
jgi:hypothetical protein